MKGRIALAVAAVLASTALAGPAEADSVELLLPFDSDPLTSGTGVLDISGSENDGTVLSEAGGAVTPAASYDGTTTSARFPEPCTAFPCPKAIIEVPHDPTLNPGYGDLSWGSRVRLAPHFTSAGQNILQKGLWQDPQGQWKLQVDGFGGNPSCVVSGTRPGGWYSTVTVTSSVSIADGEWHLVQCRRTSEGLSIRVDGVTRDSESMAPVELGSTAPVTIGGKSVDRWSDQFHGLLDDVFVRAG